MIKALTAPIARPKWPLGLPQKIWDQQRGLCYHCHIKLPDRNESPRKYDIDHYPVKYSEISDNACPSVCIKVSDTSDETNIIASCQTCNRSHRFELEGRSQCFVPRRLYLYIIYLLLAFSIGYLSCVLYNFVR